MEKVKTIIWFQGETPTTKDTLLIDGKEPELPSEREKAFNLLTIGRINIFALRKKLKNDIIKLANKVLTNREFSLRQHEWYLYINDFVEKRNNAINNGKSVSPSLLCYDDSEGRILIRSHFTNIDDSGRRIVYSFCAGTSNMKEACKMLNEIANDVGKECNKMDFDFLFSLEQLKKKRKKIFRVIISLFLILSIVTIWIINNY